MAARGTTSSSGELTAVHEIQCSDEMDDDLTVTELFDFEARRDHWKPFSVELSFPPDDDRVGCSDRWVWA